MTVCVGGHQNSLREPPKKKCPDHVCDVRLFSFIQRSRRTSDTQASATILPVPKNNFLTAAEETFESKLAKHNSFAILIPHPYLVRTPAF